MILRNVIRVWWSSNSNVIKRHGYYKYTSTSASVERNLLELNKKFNKPKQPINPFIRFLVKYKPLFIAKYPTASLYELHNRIAAVWFQLTPDVKIQYYDQFWSDAVVYYKFMDDFRNDLSEEKKRFFEAEKELRDELQETKNRKFLKKVLKKPKRTSTSFAIYVSEKLETLDSKQEIKLIDFVRKVANEWRSMSEDDKKKYVDLAKEKHEKYKNEIANWERDVIKKGYAYLLPKNRFFDTLPSNRDRRKKTKCNENSCDEITDIHLQDIKLPTKY